jgi:homocitrate synthase NifV
MREGLDVPGVALDPGKKRALLEKLDEAGVPEAEIVAPGHFDRDLAFLAESGAEGLSIRSSGLIYGAGPCCREQIGKARGVLDRVDILAPLSDQRPPAGRGEKAAMMKAALRAARDTVGEVGVGFPHATQVDPGFLLDLCGEAVREGAGRITLYDTNGSADPWSVGALVRSVRSVSDVALCFHAHNDLGMATANAFAAVRAGARCLDVTVNGLGDRAGNASLEQVALVLHERGVPHGLKLDMLGELARIVAEMTGIPVSKLAPVVGEFAFRHKSPSHLVSPALFEAFDPTVVGAARSICDDA